MNSDGGNTITILPPKAETEVIPFMLAPSTLELNIPEEVSYHDWLILGRSLATQKRQLDWFLGDWIAFGRERFPEQIELALADISDDPRNIRLIEKTARTFPPHLRNAALTFEHHAHVADMPVQEALPLLRDASERNLTAKQLRTEAMLRKMETGQILVREDDPEYDAMLACVRAWNRAPVAVREDFAEMVAGSDFADIEP